MGTTGKGEVMAPSRDVGPAWHTFMLHSQEYAEWCDAHFGRFPRARVLFRRTVLLI